MALEIRELVIKVTITPDTPAAHSLADPQALRELRESIIKECMEHLLAKFEREEDR